MAWLERLPALVDPVPGVPDTWRARLEDGSPAVVRRYPEPERQTAAAAAQRLRGLAGLRSPHLLGLLGAVPDAGGLAVVYEADLGTGLERALDREPLSAAAGTALADDIFEGLETLHRGGFAHGAVGEHAVRLYPDGGARLWAGAPRADDSAAGRSADVRASAQLLCRALGVAAEWSAAQPLREAERSAPALAATLRALGRGTLDLDAGGARGAVREAAGGLADEQAVQAGREELAAVAGARRQAHHPPVVELPSAPRDGRALLVAGAIVAGLLVLGALGALGWRVAGSGTAAPVAGARSAEPLPTPAGTPKALPSLAPPISGAVSSVAATLASDCSLGTTCTVEVDVHFVKATAPELVAWQFQLVDHCTGDVTYVDGSSVQALKGWVHVVGDSRIRLPAGHSLAVVAVTTTPSQAASPPVLVSGGAC